MLTALGERQGMSLDTVLQRPPDVPCPRGEGDVRSDGPLAEGRAD